MNKRISRITAVLDTAEEDNYVLKKSAYTDSHFHQAQLEQENNRMIKYKLCRLGAKVGKINRVGCKVSIEYTYLPYIRHF